MTKRTAPLFVIHLFVGLGAMAGGLAAILNPIDPLGAPLSLLEGSPFRSFLLIGLFLFTVLGLGNLLAALLVARFSVVGPLLSLLLGVLMMLWIVIQCVIISSVVALHIIFFVIGALQVVLASRSLHHSGAWSDLFYELTH